MIFVRLDFDGSVVWKAVRYEGRKVTHRAVINVSPPCDDPALCREVVEKFRASPPMDTAA